MIDVSQGQVPVRIGPVSASRVRPQLPGATVPNRPGLTA
jgi:hypothetical protein